MADDLICSPQRGLVGEVISRFEKRGFQLRCDGRYYFSTSVLTYLALWHRALKVINVERSLAERHYSDLKAKPFFKDLVGRAEGKRSCSRVVAAIVQRLGAAFMCLIVWLWAPGPSCRWTTSSLGPSLAWFGRASTWSRLAVI